MQRKEIIIQILFLDINGIVNYPSWAHWSSNCIICKIIYAQYQPIETLDMSILSLLNLMEWNIREDVWSIEASHSLLLKIIYSEILLLDLNGIGNYPSWAHWSLNCIICKIIYVQYHPIETLDMSILYLLKLMEWVIQDVWSIEA